MTPMSRSLPGAALVATLSLAACTDEEPARPVFEERDWEAQATELLDGDAWYRHAVFYEVYVRSLQDSDDDGIGDLRGLIARLDDLRALGVDALWLMPIMPTPFFDSGYDVADYRAINPDYGTMDDFDALLDAAHDRGMRVLVDLVLNHTSNEHSWFQSSRTDPSGEFGDFYVWSDTPSHPDNGCGTHQPLFGDSAWELDEERQQYYFHRFYPEQPDLNYENPAVVSETLDVARFWLDRGVDGFRCDVVSLLYESADDCGFLESTKDYIRQLRSIVDEYDGAVLLAEPTDFSDTAPYYGEGDDMFHMTFNFAYGYFWGFHFGSQNAAAIEEAFSAALTEHPTGAQEALVIGSHDVARAHAVSVGDESMHRRAAVLQMTMRGTPFIYYGEEVALEPGTAQVVDNRDAARTPLPWTNEQPGFGFTNGDPWLPFGAAPETRNVATQMSDPASMYGFYRQLLSLRRGKAVWGTGDITLLDTGSDAVIAFLRDDGDLLYLVVVNVSSEPQTVTVVDANLPNTGQPVLGTAEVELQGSAAKVSIAASTAAVLRHR